jgi:hypothetical protein
MIFKYELSQNSYYQGKIAGKLQRCELFDKNVDIATINVDVLNNCSREFLK